MILFIFSLPISRFLSPYSCYVRMNVYAACYRFVCHVLARSAVQYTGTLIKLHVHPHQSTCHIHIRLSWNEISYRAIPVHYFFGLPITFSIKSCRASPPTSYLPHTRSSFVSANYFSSKNHEHEHLTRFEFTLSLLPYFACMSAWNPSIPRGQGPRSESA